mgnify:CR=1 FL=1
MTSSHEVHCRVEVDGRCYSWGEAFAIGMPVEQLAPGALTEEPIKVLLSAKWALHQKMKSLATDVAPPAPDSPRLQLTVGKHTVRLSFQPLRLDRNTSLPTAISNPVEIEILPAAAEAPANQTAEVREAPATPRKIVSEVPVLRDGDQGIITLDLSATVLLGEVPMGLRVLYESPDRRALWIVDPATGVPLLVLAEGRALLYDVVNRSVMVMRTRQVPFFRLRQVGDDFQIGFGSLDTSKDHEPVILLDAASVLDFKGNTLTFGMQPDGERWVKAVSARGNVAQAVLDTSAAYPVRRFEMTGQGEQEPSLRVDVQVNRTVPASLFSMPNLEILAARMELKRLDAPRGNGIDEATAFVQDYLKTVHGSLVAAQPDR